MRGDTAPVSRGDGRERWRDERIVAASAAIE